MMTMTTRRNGLLAALAALVLFGAAAPAGASINPDDTDPGGGGGEPVPPPPPPPPPPEGYFERGATKAQPFGTTSWGASYSAQVKIAATPKAATTSGVDELEGLASVSANARLNGGSYQLFAVRATAATEAKAESSFNVTGYLGSAAVYSRDFTSATSTKTLLDVDRTFPATFVARSFTIWAGPVPVNLKVSATGELHAKLGGQISNVGFEAQADPSGEASLYASASTGYIYCVFGDACVGAEAGVYVDLQLLRIEVPARASLLWSLAWMGGVKLAYEARGDLSLSSLDGVLAVFADAVLWPFFDEHWEASLLDWDGFDATYVFADSKGTHCLSGDCSELPQLPKTGAF